MDSIQQALRFFFEEEESEDRSTITVECCGYEFGDSIHRSLLCFLFAVESRIRRFVGVYPVIITSEWPIFSLPFERESYLESSALQVYLFESLSSESATQIISFSLFH